MAIYREDIVDIDLAKETLHRDNIIRIIGKDDKKGNRFGVRVFRDGQFVDIESDSASVNGYFHDSHGGNTSITGSTYTKVKDNVAYVTLPESCYNYEGPFSLAIKLLKGSDVIGTVRIVDGIVNNTYKTNSTPAPAPGTATYDEVLAVYGQMQTAILAANSLMDGAVAKNYSSSATYDVGEYCLHESQLYRCSTKISTAELFTSSHWTACPSGVAGQVKATIEGVAPAYSSSSTYDVGDYVSYNRSFYRCTTPISTAEAFTSSHWTATDAVTVMGQLSRLWYDVVPVWEANHAYQVGDYVTYNRHFYRMTVQPTNPDQTWTASHWTQVDVANDLEDRLNAEATAREDADAKTKSAITNWEYVKDSTNFSWKLKTSIDSSGHVSVANGFALSDFIDKVDCQTIINKTTDIGYNDTETSMWIHEYNASGTWLRRTRILPDEIFMPGSDCKNIRIMYGYGSTSGITITKEMLNTYFAVSFFKEGNDSGRFDELYGLLNVTDVLGRTLSWEAGSISATGQETASTYCIRTSAIDIEAGMTIKYTGPETLDNAAVYVIICLYSGTTFKERLTLYDSTAGRIQFLIPDGCNKIRLLYGHATSTHVALDVDRGWYFSAVKYGKSEIIDKGERISVDWQNFKIVKMDIRSNKKTYVSNASSVLIPIEGVTALSITGNSTNGTLYSILATDAWENDTKPSYATGYDGRVEIAAGNSISVSVPSDGKYLYVAIETSSSHTDVSPEKISVICGLDYVYNYSVNNENSEAKVKPYYIVNLLNKLTQMKDVPWTALHDIPKNDGSTLAEEGASLKGIPYSSVKEYDKYVGFNVSLLTFMTAAHNPYSLLYTENINGNYNVSEYGISYHGVNAGCYFGDVCSSFVSFALGMEMQYDSINFVQYLLNIGRMKLTEKQDASDLQIGDVVWQEGHVLIVSDVETDGNKNVTKVSMMDTGATFPQTTTMTADQFNTAMETHSRKIVRYTEFYKNDFYEPSEFIACENEVLNGEYEYNPDVCTFAGDYAAFREGEEIWINYNLGTTTYTGLSVYKDGSDTAVATYSLDTGHKISIGASLEPGIYTAVLTKTGATSQPTHFEVIETDVSATLDGDILTVNYSSENSTPLYMKLCYLNGGVLAVKKLTEEEMLFGQCKINPVALHQAQWGTEITEDVYLKVFFRGRYGIVRNDLIQIEI